MTISLGTVHRVSDDYDSGTTINFSFTINAGPSLLIVTALQQRDLSPPLNEPSLTVDSVSVTKIAGTYHYGAEPFNNQPNLSVFLVPSIATGTRNFQVTLSENTRGYIFWGIELSGIDTANPIGASASGSGWWSSPEGTITTEQDNALVLALFAMRGGDSYPFSVSSPASLNILDDHTPDALNVNEIHAAIASYTQATAGAQLYEVTAPVSDYALAAVLELRAAATAAKRRKLFLAM